MLFRVYTCQNAILLEISCPGSYNLGLIARTPDVVTCENHRHKPSCSSAKSD